MEVKIWQEKITIPTYEIGEAERNPIFLEKRVYQGSSGVVYPYPVVEKIYDEPVDKEYNAVFLENEYIKVMILPELGGRVQRAYDKIKGRDFIYYNQVVKPALVGLTGPWISGGIEINWPQHHRPSTYLPQDFVLERLPDGGATVWVGERERMFHQKGMAGYTLRPGQARLEIRGQVYNPNSTPQTFLWWANPAVKVNDDYQSVFPPDVNAVFDHGKRDVSTFPIATGTYYKVDYSAGVDISCYKNIPVPTSYMAVKSKYDFVGGYENDTRAGVLHVANHNVSPGKKQWTWGNGDFGRAWDRNLTDEDGPYIELMTGMYCDNQPDFTWLQPFEEKNFTQYFIPYRELGVVKNACADLMMNIEQDGEEAVLKLFATLRQSFDIKVMQGEKAVFEKKLELSPEEVFEQRFKANVKECKLLICDEKGCQKLSWQPEPEAEKPVPDPAKAALPPAEVSSVEQLFLTGHHIEQYRHATFNATDYYLEGLRREPTDIRCNNAMGLWLIRKGKFAEAEKYLRRAVATQTDRNPNPYDGEPLFNLGLALKYQGKNDDAYESFYKACWNAAWQGAGYLELARLSVAEGEYDRALYELDMSLARNWHNATARHLKCAVLRLMERGDEAAALATESLGQDKLNTGCLYEKMLAGECAVEEFLTVMRGESHDYEELAVDYLKAGLWSDCIALLELAVENCAAVSPLVWYYMAYAADKNGDGQLAEKLAKMGEECCPDYCFPNRLEDVQVLSRIMALNPAGGYAYYYLGNLWYDKRQYDDALWCWERSAELLPEYPIVRRNLALAYYNKFNRSTDAVKVLEKAFELNPKDSRIFMELDQLYKRLNYAYEQRLANFEANAEIVALRDDLYLEQATLLNQLGRHQEALDMIAARKFHPWEGGEGKVTAQYVICRRELAKQYIACGKAEDALRLLDECREYPWNLGEGKLPAAQENDIDYFAGCACEVLGDRARAERYFNAAVKGLDELGDAMYYNDQQPDKILYRGMAMLKLGRENEAKALFERFVAYGQEHMNDNVKIDYFAVSLPDLLIWEGDLNVRNKVHCNYMSGLGYLGLGDYEQASMALGKAYELDKNHQGVQYHLSMVQEMKM